MRLRLIDTLQTLCLEKIYLEVFENRDAIEHYLSRLSDFHLVDLNKNVIIKHNTPPEFLHDLMTEWPLKYFFIDRKSVAKFLEFVKNNRLNNIKDVLLFREEKTETRLMRLKDLYCLQNCRPHHPWQRNLKCIADVSVEAKHINLFNRCAMKPKMICQGYVKMYVRNVELRCDGKFLKKVEHPGFVEHLSVSKFFDINFAELQRFVFLNYLEICTSERLRENFFSSLSLSHLKHIILVGVDLSKSFPDFCAFLNNNLCNFKSISLDACNLSYVQYKSIFLIGTKMTGLENLSIIDEEVFDLIRPRFEDFNPSSLQKHVSFYCGPAEDDEGQFHTAWDILRVESEENLCLCDLCDICNKIWEN